MSRILTETLRNILRAGGVLGILLVFSGPSRAQGDAAGTYKAKCTACHGADGKGGPAGKAVGVHDFTSPAVAKMSDAELIEIVSHGKNKMPAYSAKLSDAQIKDLVAYIRQFGTQK
jgi:mono/diheme cytochrome c family protein